MTRFILALILFSFPPLAAIAEDVPETPGKTAEATGNDAPQRNDAGSQEEKIGVASCDDYLHRFESCVGNMSGNDKAMATGALDVQKDRLMRLSQIDGAKEHIGDLCVSMEKDAVKSLAPTGCGF